jgi:ABC-type phosphate transport system substrate-binding protein
MSKQSYRLAPGLRRRFRGTGAACVALLAGFVGQAWAQSGRDYISIVGSSTVYPFSTVVAEQFGRNTRFRCAVSAPRSTLSGSCTNARDGCYTLLFVGAAFCLR